MNIFLILLLLIIVITALRSRNWARKRAARGGRLLDEGQSGWYKKVNLDSLDVVSYKNCILSQVFGNYYDGMYGLELVEEQGEDHDYESMRNGFYPNIYNSASYNRKLTEAWKLEIKNRLEKEGLIPLFQS